jgi:hypothetical protein
MMYLRKENGIKQLVKMIEASLHLLTVIMAMHSSETPTFPYCTKGTKVHKKPSPCVHDP